MRLVVPGLFGAMTRITEPGGRALGFTYDSAGRIIQTNFVPDEG